MKMIKRNLKTKIDNNIENLEEPIEKISKILKPISTFKISWKKPMVI